MARHGMIAAPEALHRVHRAAAPWLGALALLGGVVWDALTLVRIDQASDNLLLGAYAAALGALLVLEHRVGTRPDLWPRLAPRHDWIVYGSQFFFGGLFSASLVFYGRAASWGPSLAYLAVLAGLLVVNELLHGMLRRTWIRLALYWLAVFSWLLFFVPVQVGYPGRALLGVSALLATAVSLAVVWAMEAPLPAHRAKAVLGGHAVAFAGFGVLMAVVEARGLIPPVPLAALELGIFHGVERREDPEACRGSRYWLRYEQPPWYRPFVDDDRTFRWREGEKAHCFSAIFAPEGMEVDVLHAWERHDPARGWVAAGPPIPVTRSGGPVRGRADGPACPWGGYRTWSTKANLGVGAWHCRAITADGREIGRVGFTVERATDPPVFVERPWD